jgi:cysteine desulfurase / selenocysteine lyase
MNYECRESPYRNLVVGVTTEVPICGGTYVPHVNFDNAATTPPFVSVMSAINKFAPWYSSIHRGQGYKSQVSSNVYENSRDTVLNFVHADLDKDTVIYVKNTTEGINKLSFRLCENNNKCVILSTDMEHHSNDLPWRGKHHVDYIKLDQCGRLSVKSLEEKLKQYKGCVKLVAVSGASNVTGFINPIHELAKLAHSYNAKILVDGAQLVPHVPVDMKPSDSPEHIDFLVFSGHKMYAPFGIGVLIGPKDIFRSGAPDYKGGGTVEIVTHDYIIWNEPPDKEEAGTPNVMGVVALTSAIKTLNKIGMHNVDEYERYLARYAAKRLRTVNDIELYVDNDDFKNRVSIIPFNIKGLHHSTVAEALSLEAGIAVRTGCFCAQPYAQRLLNISDEQVEKYSKLPKEKRPGMIRLSFSLYNNKYEVDYLINALNYIVRDKEYLNSKYSKP